jgi:single-strand DNA-binding protein
MSVNKVILIGSVGQDPEIRSFSNGDKVANFSLATSEKWRDKSSGEQKEKTEWHRVQVTGDSLVGVIDRYVKKGKQLYIEGQLRYRKYEKDGVQMTATEIIVRGFGDKIELLGGRTGADSNGDDDRGASGSSRSSPAKKSPPPRDDDPNEDIPF